MTDVLISSACRTPIGSFQGALAGLSASDLGAIAVREAVKRAGIDGAQVDRAIMGNVLSAAMGQAPARQAVIKAGLPVASRQDQQGLRFGPAGDVRAPRDPVAMRR
jgi:acetyl-CoA C-acetyltransferase